jgi:hypothetical protein
MNIRHFLKIIAAVLLSITSCTKRPLGMTADQIFETELTKRAIKWSKLPDGLYELKIDDRTVSVSLENIRRNFNRDHDRSMVLRFVDQAVRHDFADTPTWELVRPYIRFSLERCEDKTDLEGFISDAVTDEVRKLYVFISPDGSQIHWVTESMLQHWQVTRDVLSELAHENMIAIVAAAKMEHQDVHGVKLGYLVTEESPFKASFILSPAFKRLVSPTYGWPVYVMIPTREFMFVISATDREFLGHVGRAVVSEYHNSGYPLTKDVLEVGDDGIQPIGTFPDP